MFVVSKYKIRTVINNRQITAWNLSKIKSENGTQDTLKTVFRVLNVNIIDSILAKQKSLIIFSQHKKNTQLNLVYYYIENNHTYLVRKS